LREDRAECDGGCEQCAGERRGQSVTVFVNRLLERREERVCRFLVREYWREESIECDGVWEQGTGERRGQNVTVCGNSELESGGGQSVTVFEKRVLERGEDRV